MPPTFRALLRFVLLAALLAPAPGATAGGPTKVAVAAFALWGGEEVFGSEARGAAAIVAARYGAVRTVVRTNTRTSAAAGPEGIAAGLAAAARGLDPADGVLVVILTSHGSPDGIAVRGGRLQGTLPPGALAALLARVPVAHKVLIVSACFSGVFTALADRDTVVITAADATHPSFGCEAGARWTYFGRAFFDQALRGAIRDRADLPKVFARAATLVRAREDAQGYEPSNPQMAGGTGALRLLDGR